MHSTHCKNLNAAMSGSSRLECDVWLYVDHLEESLNGNLTRELGSLFAMLSVEASIGTVTDELS